MKFIFFCLVSLVSLNKTFAQGCSDAGICTLGSLKQMSQKSPGDSISYRFRIGFNQSMGIGEAGTNVYISKLTASAFITKSTQIIVQLPYQIAGGKLGTVAGFGDLTIGISQVILKEKDWKFSLQLGAKFASNNSNISTTAKLRPELQNINDQINKQIKDLLNVKIPINLDLFKSSVDVTYPMVYQSSRGTYDFIGGLSVEYKTWQLAFGYQLPLNDNNQNDVDNNQFVDSIKLPANIPLPIKLDLSYNYMYSLEAYNEYFSSRKLHRKADYMYRIQKMFFIGNDTKIQVGLLGIYHMGNDIISTPKVPEIPLLNTAKLLLPANITKQIEGLISSVEKEKEVDGSKGTTLNITAGMQHSITKHLQFSFDLGFPIVTRKAQPDGLKRSFVGSIGIEYAF